MNKTHILRFIFTFICLMTFTIPGFGEWLQDDGSLNIDPSRNAGYPSIAFKSDIPYVAWCESSASAIQIYVKHFDGVNWIQDGGGLNVNTSQHATAPTIAMANDVPYVTWSESIGATSRVYVKYLNGSDWLQAGTYLNINANQNAISPCIAAYGNIPYVAWCESISGPSDYRIFVKHFNGSSWIQDGVGSLNVASVYSPNCDLAMAGPVPYVTWREGDGLNPYQIYVKHCVGGFWVQDGGSVNSQTGADCPSIAILENVPYVAFRGTETDFGIYVKKYNGSSWTLMGGKINSNVSAFNMPRINFAGTIPYVAWQEQPGSVDTVMVKHLVNDTWVQDGGCLNIDPSRYARYPKMAAKGGAPYVVWYEDYGITLNQQQIFVKHFQGIVPAISLITPDHGLTGTQTKIQLIGPHFTSPFIVKIIRSGTTDEIIATDCQLKKTSLIEANLNLASATPGFYDVKVESGNQQDALEHAFLVLTRRPEQYYWKAQKVITLATPPISATIGGIAVGDGDNDGALEVFAANRSQSLFKVDYLANQWTLTALPTGVVGEYYYDVAVLDGISNSSFQVYGGTYNNHVYQFSGSTSWQKTDMGSGSEKMLVLAHGDGNNDGWPEIYGGSADGHVYQFKKIGDWIKTDVGDIGSQIFALTVGDGDGDGNFEVYVATADSNVYRFENNSSTWSRTVIGSGGGEMHTVVVADANQDGALETYSTCADGNLYQFKWAATKWDKSTVADLNGKVYGLVYNNGENTENDSLFAVCDDTHIYQIKNENNQWVKCDLGSADEPLYRIAIGDGDNDNSHEIYALGNNNSIYQFKTLALVPTPTAASILSGDNHIKALHNDFNPLREERTTILWRQGASGSTTIKIYTMYGKLVRTLVANENFTAGLDNRRFWDGRNDAGDTVASGIYLVYIQSGSFKDKVKVAVIKE